jgi:hypothetical protein
MSLNSTSNGGLSDNVARSLVIRGSYDVIIECSKQWTRLMTFPRRIRNATLQGVLEAIASDAYLRASIVSFDEWQSCV